MKRFWIFLPALLLIFSTGSAQSPNHYWVHSYMGSFAEPALAYDYINLVPLPDGGCIGTGVGTAPNFGYYFSHYLNRLDEFGNLVWSLPTYTTVINQKIHLYDSQHIIALDWQDSLRKIDLQGQQVWTEAIPPRTTGSISMTVLDLEIDANKNILVLRREQLSGTTGNYIAPRIIALDSNRNILLDTLLDAAPYSSFKPQGLLPTQDGNFVLYGSDRHPINQNLYISLVKFDLQGNKIWQAIPSHYPIDSLFPYNVEVFELNNQDLMAVANVSPPSTFFSNFYQQRFSANGDSLDTHHLLYDYGFKAATIKDNGHILVVGEPYSTNIAEVLEINNLGNILLNKPISVNGEQAYIRSIQAQGDNFFLAGRASPSQSGFMTRLDSTGTIPQNLISGQVFFDTIPNCIPDLSERRYSQKLIKSEPGPQYRFTDHDGRYEIGLDSGQHYISIANLNPLWQTACPTNPDSHSVFFNGYTDTLSNVNFALEPAYSCPNLHVDISSTWLRFCFSGTYYVQVDNQGTAQADSATVLLSFDSLITIDSIPLPHTALGNNEFLVELGDLAPLQTISFAIPCSTSCHLVDQNRTTCATAHVFPDSSCLPPDTLWDGSSLQVEGSCLGDSVEFVVANTGLGNMMVSTGILIAEDDILKYNGSVQLNAGQDTTIRLEANGATWTCIANQTPAHPFPSYPRAIVEACSTNAQGLFSTGRVLNTMQDDQMDFIDIDCSVLGAAYDPNDKRGFPLGTSVDHLIQHTDILDYHIRFQNTGTDTAYTVVVRDQLPAELDLSTFQTGASSHPYTLEVLPNHTLVWTFEQIFLPDSTTDLVGSQGFVKFRIDQSDHLTPGTQIKNAAEIYFDYNPAVVTDTAWHTLSDSIFPSAIVSVDPGFNETQVIAYPNPFTEQVTFLLPAGTLEALELNIYDLQGRIIHQQSSLQTDRLTYYRQDLPAGTYIFHLQSGTRKLGHGKIIAF